jgi:hypothetical protein
LKNFVGDTGARLKKSSAATEFAPQTKTGIILDNKPIYIAKGGE